jgi:exonuclease-1
MLRHYGVEPYLVFDGDYLPTKARVEKERER